VSSHSLPKRSQQRTPQARPPRHSEKEADISSLGDEGIDREDKREAVRWRREERRAAQGAIKQQEIKQLVENGEHVVLLGLLVFAALLIGVVIVVGLLGNFDLVRLGIGAVCAVSGGVLYRLGFRSK
jgi:1,4-dihydroxy-2-naphthoate octaprenyltransferase